jgi:hypothetical protein
MLAKHGAPRVRVEAAYQTTQTPPKVEKDKPRWQRTDKYATDCDEYDAGDMAKTLETLARREATLLIATLNQSALYMGDLAHVSSPRGALEAMLAPLGMKCTTDFDTMKPEQVKAAARQELRTLDALLNKALANLIGTPRGPAPDSPTQSGLDTSQLGKLHDGEVILLRLRLMHCRQFAKASHKEQLLAARNID